MHVLYMSISRTHNSLGRERPLGLDVKQSPDVHVRVPILSLYCGIRFLRGVFPWGGGVLLFVVDVSLKPQSLGSTWGA